MLTRHQYYLKPKITHRRCEQDRVHDIEHADGARTSAGHGIDGDRIPIHHRVGVWMRVCRAPQQCRDDGESDAVSSPLGEGQRVGAVSGEGLTRLRADLVAVARTALPRPGEAALNERQHRLLSEAEEMLGSAAQLTDLFDEETGDAIGRAAPLVM